MGRNLLLLLTLAAVLKLLGVFDAPLYGLTIDQALDMLPHASQPQATGFAP